ncbi:hypothetical protein [Actinoallomurus sp. NPDC052274]|uniref:hypothetical protein n=1 Tax=Actinoallomurus sp. NPDC052274 TaxID=3155420 RepID=UPI0034352EB8
MTEAYSITRARPILGDLARRVAAAGEPLTLTDHGRAIATLMPLTREQRHQEAHRPSVRLCTDRR